MHIEASGFKEATSNQSDLSGAATARGLEGAALHFAQWMERWFPDSFVVVLVAILGVTLGSLTIGAPPSAVVQSFGNGFWNLLPFSMQMALVVVTGCALATASPVLRLIDALASIPKTGRGSVAFVAFVSMAVSLLNWAFGLIFAGLMVRALGRRRNLRMDYRAASAAAYLSIGGPCLLGLSSSAALLHATPSSVPKELFSITGVIPLSDTIFTWQNAVLIVVMTVVGVAIAYATAPQEKNALTASDLSIDLTDAIEPSASNRPGDWLDNSPILTILIGGMMAAWFVGKCVQIGLFAAISNLNTYIFLIFTLAFLLHWRPGKFVRAVSKAVPSISGVVIQFPLYAGVAAILITAANGLGKTLSHYLSDFFIGLSGEHGLPVIVAIYSIVMGVFVPSAGAKWILEAPYVMTAAKDVHSNLAWIIQTYSGAETLANLLNPFWMLPLLGIVSLKARHVVGFTFLYFVVLAPITVFALWALSLTFVYQPPVFP